MQPTLAASATADAALLRHFLSDEPVRAAYLLGDLDDAFFHRCRWFVATFGDRVEAVVVSFEAFSPPALLSHGAPDGVLTILQTFDAVLPAECYAKIPLANAEAFAATYHVVTAERLWTMGLSADRFRMPANTAGVTRLLEEHLDEMLRLYTHYPHHFFEPAHLAQGLYFGRFVDGALVSIAGTHVFAPRERVAVVGNVVTATERRGQGHARAAVGRLVEALFERGCTTVALQVGETNVAAITSYRRVGFTFCDHVLQASCRRLRHG